ncbi:hypothetical protein [Microvirga yunnanensis]|uniref:hypothetical protein n=1 Tax=Microvirga yunnanensis TaxID=2953740 RepID=UPI0021C82FB5|nr:hypothetical protein [Microvirga sp. HBU67655]
MTSSPDFDTAEPCQAVPASAAPDQYMRDPERDPRVCDDDYSDREDRPFAGMGVGTVAVVPASRPPALVPDLGLPAAPCTAVNAADDVTPEEFGFVDLRDRPLSYHWRADEAVLAAAGIEPTGDRDYNRLRLAVATELVRAADIEPRVWVSISRNESKYTELKGTAPRWVSYTRMMSVLAELRGLGLIEEDRAEQHKSHLVEWTTPQGKVMVGRQSRYRATPKLVAAFRSVTAFHRDAGESVLRMKDAAGRAVDGFRETDYVSRLAAPARAYNALMRRHTVELVTNDAECNRTRIRIETPREDGTTAVQILCPTPSVEIFRSFNRGSWKKGGRFYAWYQGLPKAFREQLRIDGQEVVEVDYRALHPSILYTLRGLVIPRDCYIVPGVAKRNDAKAAMVVMIASKSRREAAEALLAKAEDAKRPWRHDRKATKAILAAMERFHAPILADLYQDKGIDLMHLDSRMTAHVLSRCAKVGLPVLPVHDSYVCRVADEARVRALMTEAWGKVLKGPCPRIEGGNLTEAFDKESEGFSTGSMQNPLQTLSPSSSSASPVPFLPVSPPLVSGFLDASSRSSACGEAPGAGVDTSAVEVRGLSRVSPSSASQARPGASPARPVKARSSTRVSKASETPVSPIADPKASSSPFQYPDDDIPLDPDFVYIPEPPEPKGTPEPELQAILDRQKAYNAANPTGRASARPKVQKRPKWERDRWLWKGKA